MIYFSIFLVLIVAVALADRLMPFQITRLILIMERTFSGLRLHQAQVDGMAMPYLEGGRGPTLVLIHGFAADKDNFTRIARHLVAHYHLIIPDLPGFGDAGRDPTAQYSINQQVARLHTFLQQLGISQVDLGGSSMGGFIAAQFAASHPDMARSLWLLDPAGTHASVQSDILQTYLTTGKIPLLLQNESDFAEMFRTTMHNPPFIPYSLRHVLAVRAVKDFELHSRIIAEFHDSTPLEEQYSNLPTPALVVWGERDLILHPSGAQATAQLFARSKVIMMPDIGHLPQLEAPRATARDYLAFRKELGA